MHQVLMCRPFHFDVTYDINPWMENQIGQVDKVKAIAQWYSLMDAISRVVPIKIIDGVADLPDLVFTANAGLVYNQTVILSKFSKSQRQPEELHFKKWFEHNNYSVVQPINYYEGEGDHLIDSQGRHWVGTGFRTVREATAELDQLLNVKVNSLELADPRWYHLDTCFCPLPNGELLWYPGAFTKQSQKLIKKLFNKKIAISESDALAFSCNAVCIGQHIFLPQNTEVTNMLKTLGYIVREFDLSEFLKAGGAAKCLVLHLNTL